MKNHNENSNIINNEDKRQHNKLFRFVSRELNLLPEKYKTPLSLKYIEGLKDSEIAITLNQNQNTTRSLIKRGLEKLHQRISKSSVVSIAILLSLLKEHSIQAAPSSLDSYINGALKQKIINSQNYQFNSTRLLASKPSATNFKLLSILIPLIIAPIIYFNIPKSQPTSQIKNITDDAHPIKNTIDKKWNYEVEGQREFKVIRGNVVWRGKDKIITNEFNEYFWLELPIELASQPFVVNVKAKIGAYRQNVAKLHIQPYLTENDSLVASKLSTYKNSFTFLNENFKTFKIYVYDKKILIFLDSTCISISTFESATNKTMFSLLIRNLGINEITAKSITKIPQEVLTEFEKTKQFEWKEIPISKINKLNFHFDN